MGEVTGEILWDIALSIGIAKVGTPKKPGASTVGNAVDDSLDALSTSVQHWDDFDRAIEQAQKANGVDDLGSLSQTSKYWDEVLESTQGVNNTGKLPRSPYEFMDNTIRHIFEGEVKNAGALDQYSSGWHYNSSNPPKGNEIIEILKAPDKYGTIEAEVKIGGIKKNGVSTMFSSIYTPDEVVDMIMQAHMNKTAIVGARGCYRGVADNGMVIEMYIYKNSCNSNIADIITAYPIHNGTLK